MFALAEWTQAHPLDARALQACQDQGRAIGKMPEIRKTYRSAPDGAALRNELRRVLLQAGTPLSLADVDRCAGILQRAAWESMRPRD